MMKIQIEICPSGPIALATLEKRLDAVNSKALRTQFEIHLKETPLFIFDCSHMDFMDSTGLGTILTCLKKTLKHGGDIRLVGVCPKVKMLLELTRADRLFKQYPGMKNAMASFEDANIGTGEK